MNDLMELPCACMAARRLARMVTRMYAEEMRGCMEPAQFGLLSVVEKRAGCTQTELVHGLGLDKTTVSRDIALMRRKGWLTGSRGGLHVTEAGSRLLSETRPHWKRAQKRLQTAASDDWGAMWEIFTRIPGGLNFVENEK